MKKDFNQKYPALLHSFNGTLDDVKRVFDTHITNVANIVSFFLSLYIINDDLLFNAIFAFN